MATVLQINSYNFASTGNIMIGISEAAVSRGFVSYTACPAARTMYAHKHANQIFIGSIVTRSIDRAFSKFSGRNGCGSKIATAVFLKKVDKIKPDIIHMHNLHGSYINFPMLFQYFKRHPEIKVVWTLHDCWAFTGGCPHYIINRCEKWMTECGNCSYRKYPNGVLDQTKKMLCLKKKCYGNLPNLCIVSPSQWLATEIGKSFLKKYECCVINNGIDLKTFKPMSSNIRAKYNLDNKFVILGVAFSWSYRKGLDIFVKLAKTLDDDFRIVLVGTDSEVRKAVPQNITCISRTENVQELTALYSAADVFLNPTREDTFPTVNIEALACGTPVLSLGSCGSAEAFDCTCGMVVNEDNIAEILSNLRKSNFAQSACIKRAQNYDRDAKYKEYISLYDKLLGVQSKG